MNKIEEESIICDLTAIKADARDMHMVAVQQILQATVEIRELPTGYAFRLPNQDGLWMELANFVQNERRCCSFWRFALIAEPHGGSLWLELTGSEEAKQMFEVVLGEHIDEEQLKKLINTGGDNHLERAVSQTADVLATKAPLLQKA